MWEFLNNLDLQKALGIGLIVVMIILAIGGVIAWMTVLFKKTKISSPIPGGGRMEMSNDEDSVTRALDRIPLSCHDCPRLSEIVDLVMNKSIKTGMELNNIANVEIIDAQLAMAEEFMPKIRDLLFSYYGDVLAGKGSKVKHYDDEIKLFDGIVGDFISMLEKNFEVSFRRDNWKPFTEVEFSEMIEQKIPSLIAQWKRNVAIRHLPRMSSINTDIIIDMLSPDSPEPRSKQSFDEFTTVVTFIFEGARKIKRDMHKKMQEKETMANEEIRAIIRSKKDPIINETTKEN